MIRQRMPETSRSPRRPDRVWEPPALRFSPTAWAKLLYLRDLGDTEVGGFGITRGRRSALRRGRRACAAGMHGASVAFDDQAVADFFDRQVDMGRRPEQLSGAVGPHPSGQLPRASMTDEETFARVFGRTDWAVMFILARQGQSYARLRFHVGPGGDVDLPVRVDYTRPFAASDHAAWQAGVRWPMCRDRRTAASRPHAALSLLPGAVRRA